MSPSYTDYVGVAKMRFHDTSPSYWVGGLFSKMHWVGLRKHASSGLPF